MPYYDVYDENDNLIASEVWLNDGNYGDWSSGPIEKGLWKTILLNSVLIISFLLFIILPLIFIFVIVPSSVDIWSSFVEGGALIILWIFSIVNIILQIKRKVFVYKLYNSEEEKYQKLRYDLGIYKKETNYTESHIIDIQPSQTEDVNRVAAYVSEIKNPLSRVLRNLRLGLIIIFSILMVFKIIFYERMAEGYELAFIGPLFAYSYILDFVCIYIMYGKKGNLLWLGVLISVILCSLTIEVSFLKNVAEYILFISMMLCNLLFYKKIDK